MPEDEPRADHLCTYCIYKGLHTFLQTISISTQWKFCILFFVTLYWSLNEIYNYLHIPHTSLTFNWMTPSHFLLYLLRHSCSIRRLLIYITNYLFRSSLFIFTYDWKNSYGAVIRNRALIDNFNENWLLQNWSQFWTLLPFGHPSWEITISNIQPWRSHQ